MKKNIKTNLKLAAIYSATAMTLSGCGTKYTNVVEGVSQDKILVRDVTDNKQRIIELGNYADLHMDGRFKYFHIGDTISVVENIMRCGYQNDKCILVYDKLCDNQYKIIVNKDSLDQRKAISIQSKHQEIRQQEQAKFDSLKCAIVREVKQR